MKVPRLANAIGCIDDDLIAEALSDTSQRKKISYAKWALLAACICLLLCSITAVAVSDLGTRVTEFFTDRSEPGSDYSESGFDMTITIEKVPVDALTGDIQEVSDLIRLQYQHYKPYQSWFPGYVQKHFLTRQDAVNYIGYSGLKLFGWHLPEEETILGVYGDPQLGIQDLHLETRYVEGEIRMQFTSSIYTENYTGEITTGARTTESVEFTECFYMTANKKSCHIIEQTALESGYYGMDGYIVEENVVYTLHIAYQEWDAKRALELMHQWADLI